jgi:protein-ribulosamine 3-kinase
MLTASFLRHIEQELGKKLRKKVHFRRVNPVSGGSINQCCRLDTSAGEFFLKANDAFRYPGMFDKEAGGLETLRKNSDFIIPEVILTGETDGMAFLALEYISPGRPDEKFWIDAGKKLAAMHKKSNDYFGFHEDNYIGSLPQSNTRHSSWADFFIEERLEKQLALAMSNKRLDESAAGQFKRLYLKIETLIPLSSPSLLHGDLWSGNFLTGSGPNPCLVDPAVYYGNREFDIAMSKLFGGFDEAFYRSYAEEFPADDGIDKRTDLHNLYPLMVHVNLFGGSYVGQVKSILKKYS